MRFVIVERISIERFEATERMEDGSKSKRHAKTAVVATMVIGAEPSQ